MKCGINMSFANRQVILHRIREVFSDVFGRTAEDLGMQMVYDVAHNTAKLERHMIDGKERSLLVHRKGATRALRQAWQMFLSNTKRSVNRLLLAAVWKQALIY
jgi:tRNA-splicing ligase RtcB